MQHRFPPALKDLQANDAHTATALVEVARSKKL